MCGDVGLVGHLAHWLVSSIFSDGDRSAQFLCMCNCGYVVAAAQQGRGFGAALCAHSQQEVVKLGYRVMQYNLVVSNQHRRHPRMEKNGFVVVGVLLNAFCQMRFAICVLGLLTLM